MRCLTVRQPWTEAIACGAKRIENRTMGTTYRGSLAIHAAKGWATVGRYDDRLLDLWPDGGAWYPDLRGPGYTLRHVCIHRNEPPRPFVAGAVLAIVQLVDVHPATGCCKPWGEDRYAASDGRRRTNVRHWVFEDVLRLPDPIAAKGRLGLWSPDPDLLAELLMAHLDAALTLARGNQSITEDAR